MPLDPFPSNGPKLALLQKEEQEQEESFSHLNRLQIWTVKSRDWAQKNRSLRILILYRPIVRQLWKWTVDFISICAPPLLVANFRSVLCGSFFRIVFSTRRFRLCAPPTPPHPPPIFFHQTNPFLGYLKIFISRKILFFF